MLELVGLSIKTHPQYSEFFTIKKDYECSLARNNISRTWRAIENDVRTAVLLGQKDRFINTKGIYSEPFLITWDSSFQYLRDSVYRNTELSSWHLYTPFQFIDRIYVMDFKVNPQNVSMNIASLVDENFSVSSKFSSLFDVISSYFQRQDVGELSIARKLVDLKDRTFGVGEAEDLSDEREKRSSLTDILVATRSHYRKGDSKYSFNDVISVFEDPEYEQEILNELTKALKGEINITVFTESIDKLISAKK